MRISDWSSDVCSSDLTSSTAAAAASAGMEPVITVTAGREQELSSAADALTVLDDRRIKALNLPQVSDLLRLMPGVSVNVQGPQGSLTQIRIRGAEAKDGRAHV